ncbi:MAG TPA: hypothetical protein VFS25_18130 [Chitinophaga sp.]|uniref:BP74-related protein n=1 Tax=Chitinophaga sp. TaxID=1869181 RepID=UPI002DB77500|nr:hypothetical protein [Chitinophaga sp.]HEU4554772.1 hypothetical protein [Chitinophaga sp.]
MTKPCTVALLLLPLFACKKDNAPAPLHYHYYEVGMRNDAAANWQWQDTAFVVAVADTNTTLIAEINAQLALPADQRNKIVAGTLVAGDGGYNTNASHHFKWHLDENDWQLTNMTIELSDGLPYTDVDMHYSYWMERVKRFTPWASYIKKETTP